MNEFRVVFSGYGKSIAIGSVDKDVHFYWKMNDIEATKTQLFREVYTLKKHKNQIDDTGDPLYIPIWKDNNDILIETGLYPESFHVFVYDQNENIIWSSDHVIYNVTNIFEKSEFVKGFYLKTWRERKGELGTAKILDYEFDPLDLKFQAIVVDSETIINQFIYKDKVLELEPGQFGTFLVNYDFFKIK